MDITTARILGHLIGDGGVSVRFCRMYFTNTNDALIEEYCSLLKKRGIPFSVYTPRFGKIVMTHRKKYVLEFSSYEGCEAKNKYVPDSVINSKKDVRIAILDSILKDEARRVSKNRIQFGTTKKKFIDTMLKLLKSLNIDIKKTYQYKREKYTQYIITISLDDLKKCGIGYWYEMPIPENKAVLEVSKFKRRENRALRRGMGRGRGRGRGWRWALTRTGPGRPFGDLYLSEIPHAKEFRPIPIKNPQPIELTYPEYETLKLADFEGLTQEQAAKRMKTSRGTVWRLLSSARKKVAQALTESRPLLIAPKGKIEKV